MEQIYIKVNANNDIIYTHHMPFDEIHGLKKSESELLEDGYLVEMPEVDHEASKGKAPILKFNPETKTLYYEYVDRVRDKKLTTEERLDLMEGALNEMIMNGGSK